MEKLMQNRLNTLFNAGDEQMAKRFVDTSLTTNQWFTSLTMEERLLWLYLQLACDHAGIWQVNWPLVKYSVGIGPQDPTVYGLWLRVLNSTEWYLTNFVEEQQGVPPMRLNAKNSCHASIIKILNNKNILSPSVGPAKALGRGYGNGNGNGKTQPYATPMDNIGHMDTIRIEDINTRESVTEAAKDENYDTPEWNQRLLEEVKTFRNIGFSDEKIKALFMTREISEALIDKAMGKKF